MIKTLNKKYGEFYIAFAAVFFITLILYGLGNFINLDIVNALNRVNNPNFDGAGSWVASQDTTIRGCGGTPTTTGGTFDTSAYYSTGGNPTGSWRVISPATKTYNRAHIREQITAPGSSGAINARGRFNWSGTSNSWRANNADGYLNLELWDAAGTTYVGELGCVSLPAGNTSFAMATSDTGWGSDLALVAGTTYTVHFVFSYRANQATGASADFIVDNIQIEFAPVGFAVATIDASPSTSLSWTASTAGSGARTLNTTTPYKVYRDTVATVTTADFLANATTNSYTDTSAVGNTTYYYSILDVDTNSNESPLALETSILTQPGTPDTVAFNTVTSTSLNLTWNNPAGNAAYYRINRCAGSGCSNFTEIATDDVSPYPNSGLTANTTYRYKIRGWNASGNGPYSATADTTTLAASKTSPSIFLRGYMRLRGYFRIR